MRPGGFRPLGIAFPFRTMHQRLTDGYIALSSGPMASQVRLSKPCRLLRLVGPAALGERSIALLGLPRLGGMGAGTPNQPDIQFFLEASDALSTLLSAKSARSPNLSGNWHRRNHMRWHDEPGTANLRTQL